jgi:uncharacterized protein YidB (DUF937 family)
LVYAGSGGFGRCRTERKIVGLFDNLAGMLGGLAGQAQEQGNADQGEGAMGILNALLNQGGSGPSSNAIGSLLGGASAPAQGEADQGGGAPAAGGLAGMLETLAANGLGEHVASWLSNNPNLPISEQQIHDALGSEQVQQLAASTGLPVGSFLQQLAQHLPAAASEAAGSQQS